MNVTECDNLIKSVKWTDPTSIISLAVLETINILVILGNCLVITAVFCSNKLRSVTNFFIVNLAVADLLVGLAVLPFSAAWEVFKVWIFGGLWCRIWLALDVWMCTASILNLCAISLDRYVAVTRPVNYPSIMSTKRAKILIAGIWVLSFVICLPPLISWKDQQIFGIVSSETFHLNEFNTSNNNIINTIPSEQPFMNLTMYNRTDEAILAAHDSLFESNLSSTITFDMYNRYIQARQETNKNRTYSMVSSENANNIQPLPPCQWKCELTNDRGYVLYSALGSFYIPMFVMLFFYWRIYRAAVLTTRAINQGFKTTKGSPHESGSNRMDESRLILRIHRGRPCNTSTPQRTPLSLHSMSSTQSINSHIEDSLILHKQQLHPNSQGMTKRATSMRLGRHTQDRAILKVSFPSSENMLDSNNSVSSSSPSFLVVSTSNTSNNATTTRNTIYKGHQELIKANVFDAVERNSTSTLNVNIKDVHNNHHNGAKIDIPTAEMFDDVACHSSKRRQGGKRHLKVQIKRFRMETKAAKTLAIIVGGFIVCWLPFFTMYLIRGFCEQCIQPTVFSVLFWLGYCNSAINPLIYALFSNDFRIAFKRIVCRCVCTRSGFRASENFQMIAARALMAPATFHKTISGCSDEADATEFS